MKYPWNTIMRIILVLCFIFSSHCDSGDEHAALLSQPHVCYKSTSTEREMAFRLNKVLTDPPPAIRVVVAVNSYNGQNAMKGSYTLLDDYLLVIPRHCSETIRFGAKPMPSTPTHQIFIIKLYTPESDKSFSKIEFVTHLPLLKGMYLLGDDHNFLSLIGKFDPSLDAHLVTQPSIVPEYSDILVPALYEDKCACIIDGYKIHKLGHIDKDNYFVDVGNYKNVEIVLTDTSNKKLPKQIFFKRFPAFPCRCVTWEELPTVSCIIPKELSGGFLTVSFNDINGISKKSAKWKIMQDSIKIFDNSAFILENFAIIDSLKGVLMLNNPNYLYLFELDTLTRSCDTDFRIKTTSKRLGADVYEFTYSREVPVELERLTQQLTYYSSNLNLCEDIKEKSSKGQTTVAA